MSDPMPAHVLEIREHVETLLKALPELVRAADLEEMLALTHHRGLTTPIQTSFILAILEGMRGAAEQYAGLSNVLVTNSKAIVGEVER